ncbi:NAD+ synthase [Acetohalobium arabaticum]|uniref:NH(3)-dependent NAD(+) synthetase n=1 Tax=Acetohalobium arabaticum (strain ATCC 49924 / DSM 5501 / Z-7288) TaxID=574087 RepID=D9QS45_ACEAZ|nr:NAD+ synthase [Acetohalobium arabaticum]ADL13336.1 NH(3)-dependent NAD(+) synthetase [Acetohalobium arabaticum DSM 5501]
MLDKNYQKVIYKLQNWIQDKVESAGCQGAVVGLSGGIDSSVTAVLSKMAFPKRTLGLIMPCESNSQDRRDAQLVADEFDIDYEIVDLNNTLNTLLSAVDNFDDKMPKANIKPRLRMTVLYYYGQLRNSLVIGTDNRSELKLGYFTKHGDGGIDLAPMGNLVKTEVREVAKLLEIPNRIINKAPSAGLWADQTDESELGLSYEEIDRYILTGEADEQVKRKVESLAEENSHKLQLPPIPEF